MPKFILILLCVCFYHISYTQNIGVGTNSPDPSAALEVQSQNQGFLLPRMSYNAIMAVANPAEGLMIYDTDNHCLRIYIQGSWECLYHGSPPSSCPDSRYVAHSVLNVTTNTIDLEVEMAQKLPMRLCYFPTANPSQIQYRACEYSANYGDSNSKHLQDITGLNASTEYTITIQTSQDVGTSVADCPTMNWEDISCPFTVTTQANSGNLWLTLPDFNYNISNNDQSSAGNWTGVNGSTPIDNTSTSWIRSVIQPNTTNGSSRKYLFDPTVNEAWVSYCVQLGTNWTPSDNVKMPGFSSKLNGGISAPGGNGGGWGGLCRSWSARSGIVRPSHSSGGKISQYVYHLDAGGAMSNHPCVNPGNDPVQIKQYGETFNGTPTSLASITDNDWHCVTQHIKLNTINTANPNDPNAAYRDGVVEYYLDGVKVVSENNLHFTNEPAYHNISFWLQVYHGGSPDNTGTTHDVFFDKINVSIGPTNNTQCACGN